MKIKNLTITLVIALAIFGVITCIVWQMDTLDDIDEIEKQMAYIYEENDVKILLYGEDIQGPKGFLYDVIDSLKEDNWQLDNDYVFLIVSDLNNMVDFTKEQAIAIRDYADEHTNFNFIYIGTDKLDIFREIYEDCDIGDDEMSFCYEVDEGNRIQHYGLWREDANGYLDVNPTLLGECICDSIEQLVRSNEN